MADKRGSQVASDTGEGSPEGTWPELGVEDPRRLGLSYPIPMTMGLAEVEGRQVIRYGSPYEGEPPYFRPPAAASALTEFTALADMSRKSDADMRTSVSLSTRIT